MILYIHIPTYTYNTLFTLILPFPLLYWAWARDGMALASLHSKSDSALFADHSSSSAILNSTVKEIVGRSKRAVRTVRVHLRFFVELCFG